MLDELKQVMSSSLKSAIKHLIEPMKYDTQKKYVVQICDKNLPLKDKIALITGGSGAIGRAICLKLALSGALVYVAGRSMENVSKVINEIKLLGFRAEPFLIDVTKEKEIDDAFNRVFSPEKNLDIFVNCAGGGARGEAKELINQRVEIIDEIIDINLRGTILCCKKAAKLMSKNKDGKIVLVSSAIAFQGKKKYSEYGAAKAGIVGFAKSFALEMGEFGINVNCVSPGYIQRGKYSQKTLKYLINSNSLKKIGTAEDIANAVYFLASEDANFITGQNLIVDGGRTLGLMGDRSNI